MPKKRISVDVYSTVEKWKSRVGEKWGIHGEYRLKRFITYLDDNNSKLSGYTPDMLIAHQRNRGKNEDFDEYEILDVVQSWVNSKSNLRAESKRGYYKAIRSFFAHNRVALPKDPSFIIRSEVAPVKSKLTVEIVRNVILASKPRYQAIFTIMVMSGLDLECFMHWNQTGYADLLEQLQMKRNGEPIRIDLPGRKGNKNKEVFYTFFGRNAREKLEHYLKIRGNHEGKIFDVTKLAMRTYWTRQLKRLGYIEPKNNQYKGNRYGLNLHKLRQVFKSRWRLSGVDTELAEFFLGHTIDQLGYDRSPWLNPEWFEEKYSEAESWLNIISENPENVPKREVTALRRELTEAKKNLEDLRKQSLLDMASLQGLPQYAINEIRTIIDSAKTIEEGLRQIVESGIMIIHSPEDSKKLRRKHNLQPNLIIVEGEKQLTKHLSQGYVYKDSIPLESCKDTVSDETWILPDGKRLTQGEKILAVINNDGELSLRGNPQELNKIMEAIRNYGIEVDELMSPNRYVLSPT